jgi:hypothetical protein
MNQTEPIGIRVNEKGELEPYAIRSGLPLAHVRDVELSQPLRDCAEMRLTLLQCSPLDGRPLVSGSGWLKSIAADDGSEIDVTTRQDP